MDKKRFFLGLILVLLSLRSHADTNATSFLAAAIPTVGLVYSLSTQDTEGVNQLAHSVVFSSVATGFLKYTVARRRPDGSDQKSFPSGDVALAFTGSTYLHWRYGFWYGLPFYIGSAAIGYERFDSDRHYLTDVIAGAALGFVSAAIHTTRYGCFYPSYSSERRTLGLNYVKMF